MHISTRVYHVSLQVSSDTSSMLSLKHTFYTKDYKGINKVNNTARAENLNVPNKTFCWGITMQR